MVKKARFEDLSPKAQEKVLADDPDFHSKSFEYKQGILKKHLRNASKVSSETNARKAKAAITKQQISSAIDNATKVVASRKVAETTPAAATTPRTGAQSRGTVLGPSALARNALRTAAGVNTKDTFDEPNTERWPKASNYETLHHDLLDNTHDHILTHLQNNGYNPETGEDSKSGTNDIRDSLSKYGDAMVHFSNHQNTGSINLAKQYIKTAAGHLSQAASMAGQRFPGMPQINVGGREFHPGEWAIHVANSYVQKHASTAPGADLPETGIRTNSEGQPSSTKKRKKRDPMAPKAIEARIAKAFIEKEPKAEKTKPEKPIVTPLELARQRRTPEQANDLLNEAVGNIRKGFGVEQSIATSEKKVFTDKQQREKEKQGNNVTVTTPAVPTKDRFGFTEADHDSALEAAHAHFWKNRKYTNANVQLYHRHDAFNKPAKYLASINKKAADKKVSGPVVSSNRGGRGGSTVDFTAGSSGR